MPDEESAPFHSVSDASMATITAPVAGHGSGPYEEDEFFDAAEEAGLNVEDIFDSKYESLVLGSSDRSDERLGKALSNRAPCRMRIYTQALFLEVLRGRPDPYGEGPNEVRGAISDRSLLRFLDDVAPGWAAGEIETVARDEQPPETPEIGVLGLMEYRVGARGKGARSRRVILRQVFEQPLPTHVRVELSAEYLSEWGEPQSAKRLRKLANTLSTFIRSNQHPGRKQNAEAVYHWTSDLEFLREEYYEPFASEFGWPIISPNAQ